MEQATFRNLILRDVEAANADIQSYLNGKI